MSKYVGFRLGDDVHKALSAIAMSNGVSISQYVRQSVEDSLNRPTTDNNTSTATDNVLTTLENELKTKDLELEDKARQLATKDVSIDHFHQQIERLDNELSTKNAQIDQLHQLVAMSQTNLAESQKQLDRANLQLEDQRRPWWAFWRQPTAT